VKKIPLSMTINGEEQTALVHPYETLLGALRDDFDLTGPKEGCGTGDCGCCTVILDGQPVTSCLVLALQADGRSVTTVEGLARGDELDPIQDAFVRHGGLQCGFCIPGAVTMARALLNENPHPTQEEIRWGLAGNLCRCTGYTKIFEAVEMAAAETQSHGERRTG
jgi:carbon-monoxide dehydrogenase small subunit